MKILLIFAAILALAVAQWAPNTASQVSNANSGFGGTSIASGTANANRPAYGGYYPGYGYYPGNGANTANQVSNANSG